MSKKVPKIMTKRKSLVWKIRTGCAAIIAPTQTDTGLHVSKRDLATTEKGFCHLKSLSYI
jgi:hypothetical protein